MDGYDPNSCNALEKPFYRPVEAAIRWCGLIAHEGQILAALDPSDMIPKAGQFPMWKCLQPNTEKILDAIMRGEIPHGRDGKTVQTNEHVARHRLTVRHTDLREWMAKYYPGQKPEFLFDETERSSHHAINADSFRALQADRDAARAELEQARKWGNEIVAERDALLGERNSLRAMVENGMATGPRAETTYLNIVGGLLGLMRGKTPAGAAQSVFESEAAIISALLAHYGGKPGISDTTLEKKFAEAKRSLAAP
jgi:hypothetical protein